MGKSPDTKDAKWFVEQIRLAESLADVAQTYAETVKKIKAEAKLLAAKRDTNGIPKTTTRPEPGRSVVVMQIGDEYELEVSTHQRKKFKVPAHVQAKYEVDPSKVQIVEWRSKVGLD
jgi:hypothetical protein